LGPLTGQFGEFRFERVRAIAYARECADILISYLNEHEDAKETKRLVEEAGRKAVLLAGDIGSAAHCRQIVDAAVTELGAISSIMPPTKPPSSRSKIFPTRNGNWRSPAESPSCKQQSRALETRFPLRRYAGMTDEERQLLKDGQSAKFLNEFIRKPEPWTQ